MNWVIASLLYTGNVYTHIHTNNYGIYNIYTMHITFSSFLVVQKSHKEHIA